MPYSEIEAALTEAAAEVLETMFFASVTGVAGSDALPDETWMSASLTFQGDLSGTFAVGLPPETSRRMAASFLGAEEETLTGEQVGNVTCELANMLCGSVLSRIDKDTLFRLSSPKLAATTWRTAEVPLLVATEEGPVALRIQFS